MLDSFLHLRATEQAEILSELALQLSRSPTILEKDIWLCWTLQTLFTMPNRKPMAFKGGTSLSKVFKAISRFSEDVDITLDYRALDTSFDPLADGVSNTRIKKFTEALKVFVREHVHNHIAPYLRKKMDAEFGANNSSIEVSDNGEELRLHYPTALEITSDYVKENVLIEFGGRNITEPNAPHQIRPDIADYVSALEFPVANVSVLAPERTFWEKATLIHVECHRKEARANSQRLSRHWYDMAMLADRTIGDSALIRHDLLLDVIKHKKIFYNASYANYDACLAGELRLVPDALALTSLEEDYRQMVNANMFIGEAPSFKSVVDRLRALEVAINSTSLKMKQADRPDSVTTSRDL